MAQQSSTASAGLDERPSLTLTRRINARPEKVYAAWTDPQKLIQWFRIPTVVAGSVWAEMDLRPGGRYRFSFNNQSGEHHEVGGIYREVVPNARLVFSWAWHTTPERESQVSVTLKPDGGGTLLTLHHERFADEAARDGHARGWAGMLDNIEQLFA
jgi:uncharacterized protein YndB with AHSA1/START domain